MPAAKSASAPRRNPGPKPKATSTAVAADPDNRRNIPQDYFDAVKRALTMVGSRQDPVMFAKILWTNADIEVPGRRAGDPHTTISNPHADGKNLLGIESTIALMHGVKL